MEQQRVEDNTPRPSCKPVDREGVNFAIKWADFLKGSCNMARVNQLAHLVGKSMKFDGPACGRLALSLWPFFEQKGFTHKTLCRAGMFINANKQDLKEGKTAEEIRSTCDKGFWAIIRVNGLVDAGRSKKGKKRWNVIFVVLSGPMAGLDLSTIIADSYLSGIVRAISGARFSKTVSGMDIFAMEMKANIIPSTGGYSIQEIDDKWPRARKLNSEIRKYREACKYGPCEKCRNPRWKDCAYRIPISITSIPTVKELKDGNTRSEKDRSSGLPVTREGSPDNIPSNVQGSSDIN